MVTINGKQYTDEEFAQMQEDAIRNHYEQYTQWRDSIKCGYAMPLEEGIVFCGPGKTQINPDKDCKNCINYKEHIYEILSEE